MVRVYNRRKLHMSGCLEVLGAGVSNALGKLQRVSTGNLGRDE